jgi:hypothetical protein
MYEKQYKNIISFAPYFTSTFADASDYYCGGIVRSMEQNPDLSRFYIPFDCRLLKVYLFLKSSAVPTNENIAVVLIKNNTDNTALGNIAFDGVNAQIGANFDCDVSISAGDYIEIKFTTPNFATNPTNVCVSVNILAIY